VLELSLLSCQNYPTTLKKGSEVAHLTVIDTPGHAPSHIALWREHDKVLIIGDVLVNMNMLTTATELHEPPAQFIQDSAQNRTSLRKLLTLEPKLVCFGHGQPFRVFAAFAAFITSPAETNPLSS